MKNLVHKAAALLLAALLVLGTAACGEAPAKTEPASQPAKTEADTKAPSTEPQTTEAPATEPPTAEEPTTAAPALVSGRYDLFDLPMNGGTETVEKYAANGLYYFLVIEDGGKGYLHNAGEENEITWNEKSINVGGSDASYKAEDGVLTIYRKNQPYQLYRLSDEPAPARGETMKKVLGLFRTDEITLENVTLADTADYTIAVKGITPPKKPYDPYTLVLSLTSKYAGDKLGCLFPGLGHSLEYIQYGTYLPSSENTLHLCRIDIVTRGDNVDVQLHQLADLGVKIHSLQSFFDLRLKILVGRDRRSRFWPATGTECEHCNSKMNVIYPFHII